VTSKRLHTFTLPTKPHTPEFLSWYGTVVARAGRRCEAFDHTYRCPNRWPQHRLYAVPITEVKDGMQPFDLSNGQCLCASHYERSKQGRAVEAQG
jgi:hypothetical protein